MFTCVSENGLAAFTEYGSLLLLLVGTMLLMVLVFGPLVIFLYLHRNPYPLVYRCFKESGLTAFFTRSSAANIPVNMQLCEKLGLDKDMYSVSIPLGATINMNGAAITITIMAMAAANTMGIQISLPAAILLSVVSALGACGASGVAGGSLLLIPMACSLFGISNDIAMQVVGGRLHHCVIQDSVGDLPEFRFRCGVCGDRRISCLAQAGTSASCVHVFQEGTPAARHRSLISPDSGFSVSEYRKRRLLDCVVQHVGKTLLCLFLVLGLQELLLRDKFVREVDENKGVDMTQRRAYRWPQPVGWAASPYLVRRGLQSRPVAGRGVGR